MSKPVVKVTRPGYSYPQSDLRNYSFNSDYNSPEIFAYKYNASGEISYNHNKGLRFQIINMRKLNSTDWAHGMRDISWGTYADDTVYINENNLSVLLPRDNTGTEIDNGCGVFVLTESLEVDTDKLEISLNPKFVVKDSGAGLDDNLLTSNIDTRGDTFKVYRNGDLSISASSVTLSPGNSNTQTTSYAHNLGYPPFFTPFVPYKTDLNTIGLSPIPSTISVNDFEDLNIESGGDAIPNGEVVYVYVDSTYVYLKFIRTNNDLSSKTFPARTINLNYTIFYNALNEDFDLTN